jgi:NAD(P)-dependent dehydrogenase (short-subunit alcohol dehydrogenase family)
VTEAPRATSALGSAPAPTRAIDARRIRRAADLGGHAPPRRGSGRRRGRDRSTRSRIGWEETLRLNLTSVFLSNRAAVEAFLDAGTPGSVLNLGSVTPFSPSPRFFATHAYAAAKAAIEGLTTSAAAYYAPRGIRFNVLLPGLIETPMSRRAVGDPRILEFVRA